MRLLFFKYFAISLFSILFHHAYSQPAITGTFTLPAGSEVRLEGFNGFDTYLIAAAQTDNKGKFSLVYTEQDYGMGYLMAEDNKPFFVILSGEDIELRAESLSLPETLEILKGKENQLFEQYAREHPRREQALSAWDFLAKIYQRDPLFASHQKPKNDIEAEKHRIREEDSIFLAGLNPDTYVSWYLPLRRLVSSVPTIAQYRTEEIPGAIEAFRGMDYTDPRLYKSGLLRETIEAHVWLIENSGRSLDSVFVELNISIDHMVDNLMQDEKLFNEITDYLFRLLERRSLFKSSEYLALKILNQSSCTLSKDFAAQLESYRSMKIGNTAPDFTFSGDFFAPGYEQENVPQKLSDLKSKYTVVVFAASWCPVCPNELYQVAGLYEKWKNHGVEVVFVSLDEDQQTFRNFAGIFPFISTCDYLKWESPVVKAWYVFATPTLYLLNEKREILLRPNSVSHADSWIDWYLVKGNK
jgi:thiol-disulfide isomerase/thioredoxin